MSNYPMPRNHGGQDLPAHNQTNYSNSLGKASPSNSLLVTTEAERFLALLGKDPSNTFFRTLTHGTGPNRSRCGRDLRGLDAAALKADNEAGASVYFITGNVKPSIYSSGEGAQIDNICDDNIAECNSLFAEWDDKTVEWQLYAWKELKLPEPSVVVTTGGKSAHMYWVLDRPIEPKFWKTLQRQLLVHCKADLSICNPARLMRLPGFAYIDKKTKKSNGKFAEIAYESGNSVTVSEIMGCLPAITRPTKVNELKNSKKELIPNEEDLIALLNQVPEFMHDEGRRDDLLKLSFRLSALIGSDRACQLMAVHSPALSDIESYFQREPDGLKPEDFFLHLRDKYQIDISGVRGYEYLLTVAAPVSKAELQIQELKNKATEVAAYDHMSTRDKKQLLRVYARDEFGSSFSNQYIDQIFLDACRYEVGVYEPILPGTQLNFTDAPWCLKGIFMKGVLNLFIGMPKTGKTSLLLAFIAAWASGETYFLGLRVDGVCPPVLLVGTDQPESDWGRMLQSVGLVEGKIYKSPPFIALYTASHGIYLNEEGINRIEGHAKTNPGLLVVIDSFTACILPLGIDENTADTAGPVRDLMSKLEPYDATVILIHHASKSKANSSPVVASRGSGALPAAASNVILIKPYSPTDEGSQSFGNKVIIESSGRGGSPVKLLIERTKTGWVSHGDGETALAKNKIANVIEKLSSRQSAVYDLIQERWFENYSKTSAKDVMAKCLDEFSEDNVDRKIRATFDQLSKKDLIHMEKHGSCLAWPREDY